MIPTDKLSNILHPLKHTMQLKLQRKCMPRAWKFTDRQRL